MPRAKSWPVERDSLFGCLLWVGELDRDGYAVVSVRGPRAHVIAYRRAGRQAAAGSVVDHACRRRNCVEPRHLEAVTRAVNEFRKRAQFRARTMTKCPSGLHSLDMPIITPEGGRVCRACRDALVRQPS